MTSRTIISAAAVVAAIATSAGAATITVDPSNPTTSTLTSPSDSQCSGCGVTSSGLSEGSYRSPFGDSVNDELYYYVQAGATGTFTYASAQSSVTFLWGSPDTYNTLTFYDASGNSIESVIPTASADWNPIGSSAKYVTIIPTEAFYSLGFTSSSNSFEFANVSTTPVPLPAAGLLLVGALGGLGVMSRKRRA